MTGVGKAEGRAKIARDPVLLLALLALPSLPACSGPRVVEEVVSGDEIRLSDGSSIRYAGIDAPEPGDPMSAASNDANATLVRGKVVQLTEGDSPGEAFVYTPVQSGDTVQYLFVNRELVLFGYARVRPGMESSARQDLIENLRQAEEVARSEGLGIWAKSPAE